MKGDKKIIEGLNELLTEELTAINIYYLHYKMQENWGYEKLAGHAREESMCEMKHADRLIERILFLEGTPNMTRYDNVPVGKNCEEQLQAQYKYEKQHVDNLKKYIKLCLEKSDYVTKEILDGILEDSEKSLDWLETQFHRIQEIGIQNYLTEHMKTD